MALGGPPGDNEIVAVNDPDGARAAVFAAEHGAVVVGEDELQGLVDAVYATGTCSEPSLASQSRLDILWCVFGQPSDYRAPRDWI